MCNIKCRISLTVAVFLELNVTVSKATYMQLFLQTILLLLWFLTDSEDSCYFRALAQEQKGCCFFQQPAVCSEEGIMTVLRGN